MPAGTVTPIGDAHFHVCERCAEIWSHTKGRVTPEERERLHRCPRCTAGPYITSYQTRSDSDEVARIVRAANTAAMVAT
jgi:hypothetical protein